MAGLIRRNETYYLVYWVGKTQRRFSLATDNYQVAKDRKRRFETDQAQGIQCSLPTKTPIGEVVEDYVQHIRTTKRPKSVQTDIYYLRDMFGPICEGLKVTSRLLSSRPKKRRALTGSPRRWESIIEAHCFEAITTPMIAAFIASQVQDRCLAPKTANRYREILSTMFGWAVSQKGIRLPERLNPAQAVMRYPEPAHDIRFLRLPQITEQLQSLQEHPLLQTMAAIYIYAGLRREEAMWLRLDDVDLTRGLIRVHPVAVNGETWRPKTAGSIRVVPISADLRRFLEGYVPAPSDGRWYFPSPKGKRWDPDNFSDDLRARNKKAGLAWTCLDFRHTFGSQLAIAGRSLHQIAKIMGNSPEICRRHYAALLPEEMHDVVEFPKELPQHQPAQA